MLEPIFSSIDAALEFMPIWGRVSLWATIMGAATMFIYGALSPQEELTELKEELRKAQKELRSYDGDDFGVVWTKTKEALSISTEQLRLRLVSTFAAGVPVLIVIIGMEQTYAGREVLGFGPAWMQGWHMLFLVVLSVAAGLVKVVFRIE